MNYRIQAMREAVLAGAHKSLRRPFLLKEQEDFRDPTLSYSLRTALRFKRLLEAETPIVVPDCQIAFQRTVTAVPEV